MAKQVVVVLADGFEEIEAVAPIDVLRRAGLDVTVAGLDGTAIRGSHGVTYLCDAELGAVDGTPDAIVLPGGLPGSTNLGESEAVKRLTQKVHESGGICAARPRSARGTMPACIMRCTARASMPSRSAASSIPCATTHPSTRPPMTSREIRRAFLKFFSSREHRLVPSSPLVLPSCASSQRLRSSPPP